MSQPDWLTPPLIKSLELMLDGRPQERVGFIMPGGEVVECANICSVPEDGFDVSDADLDRYIDTAIGTWHTHPGGTKNLSVGDFDTYRNLPDMLHLIVGVDGVAAYQAVADSVVTVL